MPAREPPVHRPAHQVTVNTLGVCSISIDGRIIEKVPSCLYRTGSYLILSSSSHSISRQRLSASFWPEKDQEKANGNLRQNLARIRRLQETHGFRFIASSFSLIYLVHYEVEWDLPRFLAALEGNDQESILRACEFYSGDLLADIGPSSEEFEEWLSDQRDRLRSRLIEKLSAAINGDIDMTLGGRSLCARKLLTLDPCNEQAFQVLMIEAAEHGDHARVHELFERCERELMNEFGVRSSADTLGLYMQLSHEQSQ